MGIDFGATLNIGPEVPLLPYLYTVPLEEGCRRIASHGYGAVDVLVPDPWWVTPAELSAALGAHGLRLSAIATAAAWLRHRLHLASRDEGIRRRTEEFIAGTARLAGAFGGATIVGMSAGVLEPGVSRAQAFEWCLPALGRLAAGARAAGSRILIEPLNRRDTGFLRTLEDGVELLNRLGADGIRLLADVYHVRVETAAVGEALRAAGPWIGHVHVADDNRRAPGFGGLDFEDAARALDAVGYRGCVSVEALPWPDSDTAAQCAIARLRRVFPAAAARKATP